MKLVACLLFLITGISAAENSFLFAGLSITAKPWDKQANVAMLEQFAREAAARGAQVIATPEGFLEGYVGNLSRTPDLTRQRYLAVGEEMDGPLLRRIGQLAAELKVYLLIGFAERRQDQIYNSAVIFSPQGSIISHYSKNHSADGEPFMTKGSGFSVVPTVFGRWGTLICHDRQFPETARILALRGAQLILIPSWGSYGEMNDLMMRVRAYENGVWVAFIHPNRSLIVDPRGKVVAANVGERDQIVMARIDVSTVRTNLLHRRRPELYKDLAGK